MKQEQTIIVGPGEDDVNASMNAVKDMLAALGFDGISIERARTALAALGAGIGPQIGAPRHRTASTAAYYGRSRGSSTPWRIRSVDSVNSPQPSMTC